MWKLELYSLMILKISEIGISLIILKTPEINLNSPKAIKETRNKLELYSDDIKDIRNQNELD